VYQDLGTPSKSQMNWLIACMQLLHASNPRAIRHRLRVRVADQPKARAFQKLLSASRENNRRSCRRSFKSAIECV